MDRQRPIVAFLYDFDKTLCTTDMEDYAFIPSLGMTPAEFWGKANSFGRANRVDGVLAYMYTMLQEAERTCQPFTRESLLYRDLFERYYPGQARMIKDFWMPNRAWEGCNVDDPSARALKNYGASGF